jgi:hypothetical protein
VIQGSSAAVTDIAVSTCAKAATNSVSNAALTVAHGDSLISAQVFARLAAGSQVAITPDAAFTEGAECNTNFGTSPNYAGSTNRKTTNASSNVSASTYTFTATAGATHMQVYLLAIPTSVLSAPPTCNAGADFSRGAGSLVSITATDSDDVGISSRAWARTGGTAGAVTLSGTVILSYTVTDADGQTATDSVTVTLTAPPTVNTAAMTDVSIPLQQGDTVHLAATETAGGATITGRAWTLTTGPSVTLTGGTTANATFPAPSVAVNTDMAFTYTVTDANGGTDSLSTGNFRVLADVDDGGLKAFLVVSSGVTTELDVWLVPDVPSAYIPLHLLANNHSTP